MTDFTEFADRWWEFRRLKDQFESKLLDLGIDFTRIGTDSYDSSIEIYMVQPEIRLSDEAQKFLYDSGFQMAFVNHTDGWETHYQWMGDFSPIEGSRINRGYIR